MRVVAVLVGTQGSELCSLPRFAILCLLGGISSMGKARAGTLSKAGDTTRAQG